MPPLFYKGKKMKKYLILFLLLGSIGLYAQSMKVIGDTTDLKLYSDSKVVLLLGYGNGSEEGAGIFRRIDSTYTEDGINAFDYPVDGYQWARVNLLSGGRNFNILYLNDGVSIGVGTFTTTAQACSVAISGATTSDVYFVTPNYVAGVDQQDVLEWTALTDTLVVRRLASGESGLKFSWLRIKK